VILAKVGKRIKTSNVQTGHYHTLFEPTVGGVLQVHVIRGWLSTDVKVGSYWDSDHAGLFSTLSFKP
jgi:hypothetical protein